MLNSFLGSYVNSVYYDPQLVDTINTIFKYISIEEVNDKILEYNLEENYSNLVDIFIEGCDLLENSK